MPDNIEESGSAPPPEPAPITVLTGGAVSLKPAVLFPDAKLFEGSTVYPNTAQEILVTTEDKLRNYLHEYAKAVGTRTEWVAPLGLFIALASTLLTAQFQNAVGVSAAFWAALFALGMIGAGIWVIVSVVRLIKYWSRANVESLVKKIKKLE